MFVLLILLVVMIFLSVRAGRRLAFGEGRGQSIPAGLLPWCR
ncbi:hypothetical protein ETAE_0891 [Edwardsiella piscicida]|uniref:Uncharacterized protein n=1 Tax=Edwardsiella piscicida TaxID=1263550 RepID=A0AAU8PC30_EDWPI|nr:hypothetical protein ETAE_0891 [Edwardsiella tarda EIB202]